MGLGEALAAAATKHRRPYITPERWQQVKHLLSEALELDTARQRQFLDSACAGDADLRAEVDVLLAHRVDTGSDPMEQCAVDASVLRLDADADGAKTGNRIGPYRILREIGRGGMGAVYLAERDDEHYRRQVAIKLIKPGLGGDVIRRRFRNEMQILAELNHANIARLFDGGETPEGVPYLVMEYVEGSPINEYCEGKQLSTEQRLNLFCTVCAAVQYAHQHLVIHRDIKPGNVLVTSDGVPKLVDFGIAKLLDQGTFGSDLTATAMPFMTPQYASPEQLRSESVTTATDVYSLGVVLYELLSGRLPYRFRSRVPHEMAKAICEDDPERPSIAIAAANGDERQTIKRPKRLHADLDNIVLMAMRKEPQRRYASAEQLAEDIQRHLNGLPVRARQDTFAYRAGKFIRRQKVAVAAAALVAITLLVGIIATTWQARVARAERARSERRFNEVRQLANSIVFEVHDAVTNLPGSTPARSLIVQRGLKYLDSLAKDAAGDRGLQRELAAAYEKLGAVQYTPTVAHLGDLPGALESHRKAAALREALVAAEPSNRDYRRELLDSYWFISTLIGAQGDMPGELAILTQQLEARRDLAATEQTGFLDRYNLAGLYVQIGVLSSNMGDVAGALQHQREALRLREELAALDPDTARSRRALTISYEYLGLALDQSGDTRAALETQQRGLDMRAALVAADPLNTDLRLMLNESYRYVGDMLLKLGDRERANEHYRKQLALTRELVAADPSSAQFRSNEAVALVKIGDIEAEFGRYAAALAHYQAALRLREELSANAKEDKTIRRDLAEVWMKLGDILSKTGSRSEALENYRKSVDTLEALSAAIPTHAGIRQQLAEAQSRLGGLNQRTASTFGKPS
jgi:eukaryotic-like serine/threonine-protein kinase